MLGYTIVVRPYKTNVANNAAIVSEVFLTLFIVLLYNVQALPALVSIAFMMFATFATAVAVAGAAIQALTAGKDTSVDAQVREKAAEANENAIQMPQLAKEAEMGSPSKTKPLELKEKKFSAGSTDSDQGSVSTGPDTHGDQAHSEDAQPAAI
jgi:hypothetical protein